jgi:hypothetical protein
LAQTERVADMTPLLARRGLFGGALALLAAPAIIRTPGILMPIRPSQFLTISVQEWDEKFFNAYIRGNLFQALLTRQRHVNIQHESGLVERVPLVWSAKSVTLAEIAPMYARDDA